MVIGSASARSAERFTAVIVNGREVEPARLLARAISWIGHPLVFVTISVALVVGTQLAAAAAWPVLLALLLSVIVPTAILLVAGVRSGRWQDADVSVREERKRFYPWAISISAAGVAIMWLLKAPAFIIRGGAVTFGLFVIAALLNLRFKISLHALFAVYCAVILFRISVIYGSVASILAGLVFWSRLFLGRHSPGETLAGSLLGLSGGLVSAW